MNTALKAIIGTTGIIAGYLTLTSGIYLPFVVKDAKRGYRENCDYLLVLGGLVTGADTPSPQLVQRIDCAAEYLKENTSCFVIPCGGCFRKEQKVSEAKIIADRLIEKGIEKSRIILEDKSTTTVENFKLAFEVIRNHTQKNVNESEIAFLTSDFHIHRATLIAKRCGLDNPRRVSCPTKSQAFRNYAREYFCAYELLKRNLNK